MSSLPASLKKVALFLERLPGIGEKTANRLAFFFLKLPEDDLREFGENIISLKRRVKLCQICFNLTEDEICSICADEKRDWSVITVVETVLDLLSFETGGIYQGIYHVLHGRIDPLNQVGPDDIKITELLKRVEEDKKIKEVILATNPDMEGEATAMYIRNKLKAQISNLKTQNPDVKSGEIKVTRLAYGLPFGANLEYADYMTLKKAIKGRLEY